jgi:hydroxyacylglutathione hydrolase
MLPFVMNLTALATFPDNEIWMIDGGASAIVIDPGQAGTVVAVLDARQLTLAAILVTRR